MVTTVRHRLRSALRSGYVPDHVERRRQTEGVLAMRWYHYVAYFFGGAFLANTVPHLVNGISGNAFQSPFASPPGEGLSSSTINVLWGMFNLTIAYLLICRVGSFQLRKTTHVLTLGAGALLMSLMLVRAFRRFSLWLF